MLPHPLLLAAFAFLAANGLSGKASAVEAWQRAQLMLRQGRYGQALQLADQSARTTGARTPAGRASVLLAARAELALGLLNNARQRIERAIAQAPQSLPLQAELSRAAFAQGDRATIHLILERTTAQWNLKGTNKTVPANLMAMATITQLGQSWTWGNDLFREAVKRAPLAADPNVAWGQLFLEKHAASEAATSFRQALKVDPKHPDAWVGLARTELERGYDRTAAEADVAAALAENPRHAGALALRGEMGLDGEDFAQAQAMIAELRNINPHDADADWLSAAIAKLRGDESTYAKIRKARLEVRQGDGDFFANVAEALVRHRRYRDARAVAEECLMQSPRESRCRNTLSTTLLRIGDEAVGLAKLREAFAADPYNTRIYNQLQLFDKTIKNNYKTVQTEHLQFRIRPADTVMLERIVAPFLEAVFVQYVKRYDYTPPYKVMFELYGDPAQFAVRTVGLPGLDVSAVCFGAVITALSPSLGKNNWALVLSHELAHVFSLGLSRERVPRWLTEGLAEWETSQRNPQWRRHDDLALWGALKRRTLPPLGEISKAFFRARSNEEAVSAYQYSSNAVGFLVQRFGFPAVRKMLLAFGEGAQETLVLEKFTGVRLQELQSEFQQHLDSRYPELAAQFLPNTTDRRELAEAMANAQRPDATADDFARASIAASDSMFLQKAEQFWQQGDALWQRGPKLQSNRDRTAALLGFASARLAESKGDKSDNVVRALQTVIGRGFDGYDIRVSAALAAMRAGQTETARNHLAKAMTWIPTEVEGWTLLASVLEQSGKTREALTARIQAFMLDAQDGTQGIELLQQSEAIQATDLVLLLAPWVVEVNPANGWVHATYGRALQAIGRYPEALAEYEHALALGVQNAAEVKLSLTQLQQRLAPPKPEPKAPVRQRSPPRGPAPSIPTGLPPLLQRGPAPSIPESL